MYVYYYIVTTTVGPEQNKVQCFMDKIWLFKTLKDENKSAKGYLFAMKQS